MRILIAGIDGYLGWPLAQFLLARGHTVAGIDCFFRRQWVEEIGGQSAIPISSMADRLHAIRSRFGKSIEFFEGNLLDYGFLKDTLRAFRPEAIIHLGEMPSAAYSMIDQEHAAFTQQNNVIGNLNILWAIKESWPNAHLVKLGTMGEYGTPNVDIPEGFFEIEYRGRRDVLPFPRQANSFYHWSKVHDSNNIMFACRIWGLRATDIMQGVVFGTQIDEVGYDPRLRTRLDFDQCFGTAINRFCCQAIIGHPLTVFGEGGQTRGWLPLRDSMQCIAIAVENPPIAAGEYRVFNQFEECYTIYDLSRLVQTAAREIGLEVDVLHYQNPRAEAGQHYYNPDRQHLIDLGYSPTRDVKTEIQVMLKDLANHRERIAEKETLLVPDIRWDGRRRKSTVINTETSPVEGS